MVFALSERRRMPNAVKILIAGGFGAGKTTMVSAVSETRTLRTEELLTERGVGVDDVSGVSTKRSTTVAMDFGRITLSTDYVLYLFGTPGQERFWFLWDELALGALGAVVLADTRRLADCFAAIDYFERRSTPFIVAVNCFEGADLFEVEEIRTALQLDPVIPILLCDARDKCSSRDMLIGLIDHALQRRLLHSTS